MKCRPSSPASSESEKKGRDSFLDAMSQVRRKMTWIGQVIVCRALVVGRDWLVSTKAAGSFVLKEDGRSGRSAILTARADAESPYIAPYVSTPQEVIDRMLQLAEVRA